MDTMGRGNVCVHGQYEGLYYIDNDDLLVYRLKDSEPEDDGSIAMLGDIDFADMDKYECDELESGFVWDETVYELKRRMMEMFRSFSECDEWLGNECHAILENRLFYICVEDNQWSMAIELIQKEDPYGDSLDGLQKRHFQRYMDGLRDALFEQFDTLRVYGGAWTSGLIRKMS